MDVRASLRNRGKSSEDVQERLSAVSEFTNVSFSAVDDYSFDPMLASTNIENMIGVVHIPLGYAGPIKVNGNNANGEFLIPLATTEGALVASVSRGMSIISEAGGAYVHVFSDAMTRAPVLKVNGIKHSDEVIQWISENLEKIESEVEKTTSHGKLVKIESFPNGRSLHLVFSFQTGDAMGMNMCTIASEAACKLICENTGASLVSVSGNMCTDKKPASINAIRGRGKCVLAEATIPRSLVESKLHASVDDIVDVNIRKNLIGSAMAGSLGFNAHAANMVAAFYLATGQDPAQTVEGSMVITTCENVDNDLYISVRIPAVEVGTVGGGTKLPAQSEALNMIDCKGNGKSNKLAELLAVTVLAGELSVLGAQVAGQLGKAHKALGR